MTESDGGNETSKVRGPQVKVLEPESLFALTLDPLATEGRAITIQDSDFPTDPLFERITSSFAYEPTEAISSLSSQFYFSDAQKAKDGGYFPQTKRVQMRERLRSLGFIRRAVNENREIYSALNQDAMPGRFTIDYGHPHKELHDAHLAEALGLDGHDDNETLKDMTNHSLSLSYRTDTPDNNKDRFVRRAQGYGRICEKVLQALYETEGLPPSDLTLLLEAQAQGASEPPAL